MCGPGSTSRDSSPCDYILGKGEWPPLLSSKHVGAVSRGRSLKGRCHSLFAQVLPPNQCSVYCEAGEGNGINDGGLIELNGEGVGVA